MKVLCRLNELLEVINISIGGVISVDGYGKLLLRTVLTERDVLVMQKNGK